MSDENIDIALRYDRAITGELKVEGVSKAFVSKVLAAHRPDLYFVKNDKSEKALRKYGIQLPHGLTASENSKCSNKRIRDFSEIDGTLF